MISFVCIGLLGRSRLQFLSFLTKSSGLEEAVYDRKADSSEPEALRSLVDFLGGFRSEGEEFDSVELI
jgi:hypothetical protein